MKRSLVLVIAIACSALPASPSGAAEDGGLQSPFVHGAGNRALAMGGAFTALADDATSPTWNPAGLGRLVRPELVASQTSLYGIDATEQYLAFGWPSWRWGTLGVTAHRIGVGGIEERDDRNVLLGEFDDSELEIGLAYGRSAGEAWHFGGTAKLLRQSLAGRSASGLGLDFGILVRPMVALGHGGPSGRGLSLGLSVRDAVAPTIRLDEESVSDPTTLRMGLGYDTTLRGRLPVRAAVDFEQSADAEADVRAGLEVEPHPLLALRTGFNGEDLTAGAGLTWRLYRVDYAFEDNTLETVHRVGVSFGFGATVKERRARAVAEEDAAFHARLEETYEKRRSNRIEELLRRGRADLADDRLDEALNVATTVHTLDPDEPRGRALEADVLARRATLTEGEDRFAEAALLWGRVLVIRPSDAHATAAMARCRTESDRRAERTTLLRELFAAALDAFSGGDLVTCRNRLENILTLVPDDAEARAMLERTHSAIDIRVSALLASAEHAMERGSFDAARTHLDEARTLDAEAPEVARMERRIARAAREQRRRAELARATPEPEPTPTVQQPALSEKQRREIADLYRRGIEAMEEDRTEDALRYWELVWMADPEHQEVAEFLKREYLLRGLESFTRGSLDEALRLWEKARDVDPEDEKTLGYLSRAREQLLRTQEILGE